MKLRTVSEIDKDGFFIRNVVIDEIGEIPNNCVEPNPPTNKVGFRVPRWNGVEWTEGLSQEEIDEINNRPKELSESDLLMLAVAELDTQREIDKTETQMAIAELATTILGGM